MPELDVWRSILTALESIVVIPSLIQAVFPSLPSSKRVHNVVRVCDRNMDEYLREVKRLLETPLKPTSLLAMSAKLQRSFHEKLQNGDMCMLPSFNHTLPTGHERGTYLALDVGGSTFRIALVELQGKESGKSGMQIIKMKSYRIDNQVRALEGHAFFDWMAEKMEETLADPEVKKAHTSTLPIGLSWSFPVEQTSIRNGKLLQMGKSFQACQGLIGQDLGALIMQACAKKNLNVSMGAIVNDSSATLLSRAYQDQSTRLALILGTGTNAAVHLPVTALARSKYGERPQSWHDQAQHVLVNTEFSMFGKNILPMTRWDDYLNSTHLRPDFQPFEHFISGAYLGEIVRLILLEAIRTAGLFGGEIPEKFGDAYALETETIAWIESDDTPYLSQACTILQSRHRMRTLPTYNDLVFVRKVCQLVSHRAAAYLATAIHALWSLRIDSEGMTPATADRVTIGCNGSVIEKYPSFKTRCQAHVDELTALSGAQARAVVLEPAIESAIIGAAVAACCLEDS